MDNETHLQISTPSEPTQKLTMGNTLSPQNSSQLDQQAPQSPHQHTTPLTTPTLKPNTKSNKLQLIPLIFLIYFEVSGGPFGAEPAVKAAGPFYALLGFLVFPFIWSIPEALITAELATAFPGNGGYVIWASHAFGPFFGSLMGSWKFISGVINNAAHLVLCADYLKLMSPAFSAGLDRYIAISFFTLILSFLNYTGLTMVGYTAVCLGVISLLPFVTMTLMSIKKIHPGRWINFGDEGVKKDWSLYFNTLFWNLNFWDNVSTLAGEVDRPHKTFPKALLSAGFLTCLGYFIPLLAAVGALVVPQSKWDDGFFADGAGMIAGKWLKIWVEIGSVLSAIGLYEAQLSSCVYQLEGMADMGYVPLFFAKRSKWFDTPWIGILVATALALAISYMDFTDIISSANFFDSLSMLLEFSAFIWLRWKYPLLKRPYKVPMGMFGILCMCLVPAGFVFFVMTVASKMVYVISAAFTVVGVVSYFFMNFCKSKGWFDFSKKEDVWGEEIIELVKCEGYFSD